MAYKQKPLFLFLTIAFCETLERETKDVIGNQLLKLSTSIGANSNEDQHEESKTEFIPRAKIVAKQTEETKPWMVLCKKAKNYPLNEAVEVPIKDIGLITY
jgi:four helix bundle protein